MKPILVVAMLAACGTNSSPHDMGTCGSGWAALGTSPGSCEQACVEPPAGYFDPGSTCGLPRGAPTNTACKYFEYDGVKGCCLPHPPAAGEAVVFYECTPQP